LETSVAKLGYTVIGQSAIDAAKIKLGIGPESYYRFSDFEKVGQELDADFIIFGQVFGSIVSMYITDMKTGEGGVRSLTRLNVTQHERNNQTQIDTYTLAHMGKADMQAEKRQKFAEERPKREEEERQKREAEQQEQQRLAEERQKREERRQEAHNSGQYTVAVMAVVIPSKLKPIVAPETLTRLLETSAAKLGYAVIDDRAAINEAYKKYNIGYSRMGQELGADFVIIGTIISSTFTLTITNINTGEQSGDRWQLTRSEKGNQRKFDKVILSGIGKAEVQQIYQQELAKREAEDLPEDAWRNKGTYMGLGGGVGFGGGLAQAGSEVYNSFGGNVTGAMRFDFGKNWPKVSNKGYVLEYAAFGTGLFVSVADGGNTSFMIPLEARIARRYDHFELGYGFGLGVAFGPGSFALPINAFGSIGWKAGPGIIFLEGEAGYNMLSANSSMGFSGSAIMGYKFGLGKSKVAK
jgi:TolB-like protein